MTSDASNQENAYLKIKQLIQQSDAAAKNHQLEEAIAPVQTALELYRENSSAEGQVYALNKLADLHQKISKTQYERAIQLLMAKSRPEGTADPGGPIIDPPPLPPRLPLDATFTSAKSRKSGKIPESQDPGKGIPGTPPPAIVLPPKS
ncbi:MAG: hypothetical protein DCF15_21475 [Phormidesmis priestleyi]|uniref:Uncharacterized protein n=1 Tax=Phormidesmis priestleyi TaxID=268141 RepID=A0A2W4YFZ8_9CYAN|nr:MAG: hypothetical protein DCF15_21475 [Phormidesmis priestleyi]